MKKQKGEIIERERGVANVGVPFYKKNVQPRSHVVDVQHKEVYRFKEFNEKCEKQGNSLVSVLMLVL